jgi:acetyl-CoA/propionyl-CoA carboxylase biotin carboxyl carrier protein
MDDALRQGDDLVTDYDSMVAKLIVSGEDRTESIARAKRALGEYEIEGIVTIIPFHRMMMDDQRFVDGMHTTKYLDEHMDHARIEEAQQRWGTETTAGESDEAVTQREFTVEVDGKRFEVELEERGAPPIQAPSGDSGGSQQPDRAGPGEEDSESATVSADGETVAAEMQGTILEINVSEGDEVGAGDVLCVLEAMKMENDILAEYGGTIAEVAITEGDSVDMGDPMFVIE